jgi:hypothetical protein
MRQSWPAHRAQGGFLIVVPKMENAAAAGRAQYAKLQSRNILPGAILVNLRGLTPQLAAGAVDPLSGSEDQIRPRRRSSVPAVHPGAAEPLLGPKTRLNPGKMGADPGGWINPPWTTGDPAPRLLTASVA